jgi:hypothetical protein
MDPRSEPVIVSDPNEHLSRRATVRRLIIGGGAAVFSGRTLEPVVAQEATPAAGECVATAPPLEDGIGFAQLLVGGIVHDMPSGPVEVRLSRLAMAPGTTIEASAVPYPALMYMETGTTACPGGPGRIGYGPDGTIIEETTGEGSSTPQLAQPNTSPPMSRMELATRGRG